MTTLAISVLAAVCAAAAAGAVMVLVAAVTGNPRLPTVHAIATGTARLRRHAATAAAAVATGALAWAVTGWPVTAPLAAAAVIWLPPILGPDRTAARDLARVEALATWAEQLRDTLAAASGIEATIRATTTTAPEPIAGQLRRLDARLAAGQPLPAALQRLAGDLADPVADLIVSALRHAARRPAAELGPRLSGLATAAREQAAMRIRAAAGQARTRTSIRVITSATLTIAAVLMIISRGFLAPYNTTGGQLALAGVGACFAIGFAWLRHLARPQRPARFLHHPGGGVP